MGQQCSCLQHAPKYQRRRSDASDTMDTSVDAIADTADADADVEGQELQVLLRGHLGGSRSSGAASGSRVLKRTNSGSAASARADQAVAVDAFLVEDEEEKEEEKDDSASAVERQMLRKLNMRLMGSVDGSAQQLLSPSPQQADRSRVLQSYREATGLVDEGQMELECIMCLDTFSQDNPKVRTLCNCGMNRTNFHLSCLLEWLNRDANCPVCRAYLYYEEP